MIPIQWLPLHYGPPKVCFNLLLIQTNHGTSRVNYLMEIVYLINIIIVSLLDKSVRLANSYFGSLPP